MDLESQARVKDDQNIVMPTKRWTFFLRRELTKKLVSEFLGTFILLFGAAGSSIMQEKSHGQVTFLGVGAAAGLVVMVVILSTGHISGAHINPAVTLAFATFKYFPWIQVPLYILAQVSGSICSSYILRALFHVDHLERGGVTIPSGSVWQSLFIEFILTIILMFVVIAVSTDTRAVGELAGIAVGVTVILNNFVAGPISGASMNPVRSLGPAVATNNYHDLWLYIVGPICGAIVGAGLYTFIRLSNEDPNNPNGHRTSSFRHFN